MNENQFRQLLSQKENKDLDYKQELPEPKKVAQLVTAFYNSRGGKIVLGVEDEPRKPAGLDNAEKTEHKFVQIIRHWCKLDREPRIEFVKYEGKDFVVAHCPKGEDTPYFVRGEYIPRVRIGSSNMPANKDEIARLYREGSHKSQDVYPVENATLDDIDLRKVKDYLEKSELTNQLDNDYLIELMVKEHLAVKEKDAVVPTIAGILLFGKNPHRNITQCEIRADRYVGDSMTEWIDRKDIHGTLFEMIKETEEFMLKNMRTPAKVVGFKTEFRTEYPLEALREAIINALVHRDWHSPNAILVRMFGSHIDILSPGELLRPLKVEEIVKDDYVPLSRNKTVIEAFGLSGIMDKRGTGFLRIREAMKKHDLPIPVFDEKTGYFRIRFINPAMQEVPVVDETVLNDRQSLFFEKIAKDKITTQDYIELTGCNKRTAIRDLEKLVLLNLIEQKGPVTGRGRYYAIKVTKGDKR